MIKACIFQSLLPPLVWYMRRIHLPDRAKVLKNDAITCLWIEGESEREGARIREREDVSLWIFTKKWELNIHSFSFSIKHSYVGICHMIEWRNWPVQSCYITIEQQIILTLRSQKISSFRCNVHVPRFHLTFNHMEVDIQLL